MIEVCGEYYYNFIDNYLENLKNDEIDLQRLSIIITYLSKSKKKYKYKHFISKYEEFIKKEISVEEEYGGPSMEEILASIKRISGENKKNS